MTKRQKATLKREVRKASDTFAEASKAYVDAYFGFCDVVEKLKADGLTYEELDVHPDILKADTNRFTAFRAKERARIALADMRARYGAGQ